MTRRLPCWRSLLFVPANVDRFIARAHERGADGIILDLEDAVPAAGKEAARRSLPASIATARQSGGDALVRVNPGLRGLSRDLEAAVHPGLSALVLPKVEEAGIVRLVADAVAELEVERRMEPDSVRLLLQIETPGALFALPSIARAHPRIAALSLGPEDFSASMGGVPDAALLLGPSLAVAAAARAAGVLPLGYVGSIGDFKDAASFRERIAEARRLGFAGGLAIHPAQVVVMNEGFSPTEAELDWARRVTEGDAEARANGRGAFQIDGKMIDAPVVRRAAQIIQAASRLVPRR